METVVALALTSLLAVGVLSGLRLVEESYARWGRGLEGHESFGGARSLMLADAWSANSSARTASGVTFGIGLDSVAWATDVPGRVTREHTRAHALRHDTLPGYLRAEERAVLLCPRPGSTFGCVRVAVSSQQR